MTHPVLARYDKARSIIIRYIRDYPGVDNTSIQRKLKAEMHMGYNTTTGLLINLTKSGQINSEPVRRSKFRYYPKPTENRIDVYPQRPGGSKR